MPMPRMTRQLSATEVKNAKPKEKEYSLHDGMGLELCVKPNGAKLWRFRYYRPITKKRTMISFGEWDIVSLAGAREKRDSARVLLDKGIDPQEHQKAQTEQANAIVENTFSNIAAAWFELKKTRVTPDYAHDVWRSLERDVFPFIGEMPIAEIKAKIVIEALEPVKAKGALETLKRLIQRINEIMIYAVNAGIIEVNPTSGIRHIFAKPQKKNMPTLKPEQLPELMFTLAKASITLQTRCLIEWSRHTMVRPSEAAGTRWDEIDIENKIWTIPAERMKKRKPHSIPLTAQSLLLLEVMRPISGHRDFVFPSHKDPKQPTNNQTANAALKRMGFDKLLVAHGLRALASTTLNEQGFDSDVIEAALSHVDKDDVRRAYNRTDYFNRRIELMKWWSDHIQQAARGNLSLAIAV